MTTNAPRPQRKYWLWHGSGNSLTRVTAEDAAAAVDDYSRQKRLPIGTTVCVVAASEVASFEIGVLR